MALSVGTALEYNLSRLPQSYAGFSITGHQSVETVSFLHQSRKHACYLQKVVHPSNYASEWSCLMMQRIRDRFSADQNVSCNLSRSRFFGTSQNFRSLPSINLKASALETSQKRQSNLHRINAVVKRSPKRLKYAVTTRNKGDEILHVRPDIEQPDARELQPVCDIIRQGGVGVIPTDTVYALVCDLKNRAAVERMYRVKEMDEKKPLSILCRSFNDIDTFTLGFPQGNAPGQSNVFRVARQCLPGPYTIILKASKEMPKQCTTFGGSVAAQCAPRRSVGVRMPDDPVCQAVVQQLDAPLLCTSVMLRDEEDGWVLDPEAILETYSRADGGRGIDFIVDGGPRVAHPSTVIDMTGEQPVLLRLGKGPVADWMMLDELDVSQWEEEDEGGTGATRSFLN
eukprot:TRINITY_DN21124_c0_g1_i1.p1 TRINITY_DN21124_c0_g1~~TRINITY_DN21124_c0_g1_i1.p1  ORF type:complete len:398 (+),score=39.58 TRINITY_DN21124_c0_g1_i1:235-1428(+)